MTSLLNLKDYLVQYMTLNEWESYSFVLSVLIGCVFILFLACLFVFVIIMWRIDKKRERMQFNATQTVLLKMLVQLDRIRRIEK